MQILLKLLFFWLAVTRIYFEMNQTTQQQSELTVIIMCWQVQKKNIPKISMNKNGDDEQKKKKKKQTNK